ncbi:MAG TPA: hypothetical protein VFQ53_03520 [Kofleriaceae bacterium]|nr:hypothetical protein [Kofleriaceae bacterium]
MKRTPLGDGWYDAETPLRVVAIAELQRIARRTVVRPIPVLLLAAVLTAGVTYKFWTKKRVYPASVVLAISEGKLSNEKQRPIPYDELQGYVSSVLLPDKKLLEMIERRDLHRLRRKLGPEYALTELRQQLEIEIWKNSFVYYHEYDANAQKSARIGITIYDEDPDDAYEIAHDIASIIIETHDENQRKISQALAQEVAMMKETMLKRVADLSTAIAVKQAAYIEAQRDHKPQLAAALGVDLNALVEDEKRAEATLAQIAASPDAVADRVTAAGLDTTIRVVDERRPPRPEQSGFVLAMVIAVIGTGSLLGSAMVLGAFDSRVHDADDVARLGLPVLGHVPGFQGDHVGSLEARGAARARVPSFLRWRSQR